MSFLFKRLFFALLLCFVLSFGIFALVHFSKGSVVFASTPQNISYDLKVQIEKNLKLDTPLLTQYTLWLKNAMNGNLGHSLISGEKVSSLLKEPLINTFILGVFSLFVLCILSFFLGILSIYYKESFLDKIIHFISLSFFSLPSFALCLALVLIFAVYLQILPSSGTYDIGFQTSFSNRFLHLILPSLALILSHLAVFLRFTRVALIESLNQSYIESALARGFSKKRVYFHFVPLHALGVILAYYGASSIAFISNTYIIESVFSYNGIGNLALQSILFKDYRVLLPIVLLSALFVFVINFSIELVCKALYQRQNYA